MERRRSRSRDRRDPRDDRYARERSPFGGARDGRGDRDRGRDRDWLGPAADAARRPAGPPGRSGPMSEEEDRLRRERHVADADARRSDATRGPAAAADVPTVVVPQGELDAEQIAAIMGFGDFASTKGKQVADNMETAARGYLRKNKKLQYRQYMNKKGGRRMVS